jgi:hypothetical protein
MAGIRHLRPSAIWHVRLRTEQLVAGIKHPDLNLPVPNH